MYELDILLASTSPRRRQLLKEMGFNFESISIDYDENFSKQMDVYDVPKYLSKQKASYCEEFINDKNLVITADTVVIHENTILNKPKDSQEAESMIQRLSSNIHEVVTGVTVKNNDKSITFSDLSEVHLSKVEQNEIAYYINNFSPMDKAGAYGIQEWFGHNMITKIIGSYTNIMGLPTQKLFQVLKEF